MFLEQRRKLCGMVGQSYDIADLYYIKPREGIVALVPVILRRPGF